MTLLYNCMLFAPWIPTISSFENECLARTYLILTLVCELQGCCTLWAKVRFSLLLELLAPLNVKCLSTQESQKASLFHLGVLKLAPELAKQAQMKWELFSSGAVAFVFAGEFVHALNVSQFKRHFFFLHTTYNYYESPMEKPIPCHCIRY